MLYQARATALEGYQPAGKPFDGEKVKAESATWVARIIVGAFAATIALVLTATISVVVMTGNAESAKRFTDTLVPMLDSLGKFLSGVFGPLLAFILGYYFSEKQKGTDTASGK